MIVSHSRWILGVGAAIRRPHGTVYRIRRKLIQIHRMCLPVDQWSPLHSRPKSLRVNIHFPFGEIKDRFHVWFTMHTVGRVMTCPTLFADTAMVNDHLSEWFYELPAGSVLRPAGRGHR